MTAEMAVGRALPRCRPRQPESIAPESASAPRNHPGPRPPGGTPYRPYKHLDIPPRAGSTEPAAAAGAQSGSRTRNAVKAARFKLAVSACSTIWARRDRRDDPSGFSVARTPRKRDRVPALVRRRSCSGAGRKGRAPLEGEDFHRTSGRCSCGVRAGCREVRGLAGIRAMGGGPSRPRGLLAGARAQVESPRLHAGGSVFRVGGFYPNARAARFRSISWTIALA